MPYVSAAARGPWVCAPNQSLAFRQSKSTSQVVTVHGGVIHDNGGYGMLGAGHNSDLLQDAVSRPQVMANVMTPCFAQARFFDEWKKQVGFSRKSGNPYSRIMTMNSGSEAVELSARLTDKHAKLMTDPGAVHAGSRVITLHTYRLTCGWQGAAAP